jgi:redox-sensitive bicupin YhaK (pirin superfamily)
MQAGVKKSEDRGSANFGWLDNKHSFSFRGYQDPEHMGFGPLGVVNENPVAVALDHLTNVSTPRTISS